MARIRPDYWYYKNVINKKQIKEINSFIEKNYDQDEPTQFAATDQQNNKIKNLDTKIIYWAKVKPLLIDIHELILNTNYNNFGYDIYPLTDQDFINYNVYSSKTKDNYGWHIDAGDKPYKDIKLTTLINVSEKPYKGGTLNLFSSGPYVVNEFSSPGDMIIFRSYINHMVMPVESGERKTIALFMEGPLFK
jgi:predicted 2-oxoglutarate/Fe(II)-dependent dioxygenase YbiX